MGVLTHAQLVTEALELAGNTGLVTRAQTWLGLIFRRLSEQFTFPQQVGVVAATTITSGSLVVGGAAGTIFINFPVRGIRRVQLATLSTQNDYKDLIVQSGSDLGSSSLNALVQTPGRPVYAILTPQADSFLVNFVPTPDQNYRVFVEVDGAGWAPNIYSAAVVNLYPDDLTVIQGIYALALRHQQDERAPAEWALFEKMAREDRVRYGNQGELYKIVRLRPTRFTPNGTRRGNPNNNGPGWMGPV